MIDEIYYIFKFNEINSKLSSIINNKFAFNLKCDSMKYASNKYNFDEAENIYNKF